MNENVPDFIANPNHMKDYHTLLMSGVGLLNNGQRGEVVTNLKVLLLIYNGLTSINNG